jgi:phosphoribosylaminoimidazole-succinocarboxamide synthase
MQRGKHLVTGKSKTIFLTDDPGKLILLFRNDSLGFEGERVESIPRKGRINNLFNAHIMTTLEKQGIRTHFDTVLSDEETVVKRLDMVPVKFVVRNSAAGSICKRLGVKEGMELDPPVVELYLKNDTLNDPMINGSHVRSFKWATEKETQVIRDLIDRINLALTKLFADAGMRLVDYKLEFGRLDDAILLGDEISPERCRLWDAKTGERMDKDRLRRDSIGVVEAYEEVARRIGARLD